MKDNTTDIKTQSAAFTTTSQDGEQNGPRQKIRTVLDEYRNHFDLFLDYAANFTDEEAVAENTVHDSFINALEDIDQLPAPEKIRYWLMSDISDQLGVDDLDAEISAQDYEHSDDNPTPYTETVRKEQEHIMAYLIKGLSDDDAENYIEYLLHEDTSRLNSKIIETLSHSEELRSLRGLDDFSDSSYDPH